jgi:hypothetical protein
MEFDGRGSKLSLATAAMQANDANAFEIHLKHSFTAMLSVLAASPSRFAAIRSRTPVKTQAQVTRADQCDRRAWAYGAASKKDVFDTPSLMVSSHSRNTEDFHRSPSITSMREFQCVQYL